MGNSAIGSAPWIAAGLVGTVWYAALATLGGPLAKDIAVLGLLLFATLGVWIFGRPPSATDERPRGDHRRWGSTIVLSVGATGAVAALGTFGVSVGRWPAGRPAAAVVMFAVVAVALLVIWGGWAVLVGLTLSMMGASIRPAWLLSASGRWLPWVPVSIGALTAYQLLLLPGVPSRAPAVALPTNVAFGALSAFAVLDLSREVLRARSELGLRGMTPLGSVLVGAMPLALIHVSKALWTLVT